MQWQCGRNSFTLIGSWWSALIFVIAALSHAAMTACKKYVFIEGWFVAL